MDFVGGRTDLYNIHAEDFTNDHRYADPNFDQDHEAYWGRHMANTGGEIAPDVAKYRPDVVLVQLGINDLVWTRDIDLLRQNMRDFISRVRAAKSDVKFVFGLVLPSGMAVDDPNFAQLCDSANAMIKNTARSMSTPSSPIRIADARSGCSAATDTWDSVHPDTSGQAKIAASFANAMTAWGIGTSYSVQTPDGGPKVAPRVTVDSGDGKATIHWSTVPGTWGYWIETRNLDADELWTRLPIPLPKDWNSYTFKGLTNGERNQYRVVPSKGTEYGPISNTVTARPKGPIPGAPELTATVTGQTSIKLEWNAVANATSYAVQLRDVTRGEGWHELSLPTWETSFEQGWGAPGHTYQYRVQSLNGMQRGGTSDPVTVSLPKLRYVALGDSFSAGTGAGDPTSTSCYRSAHAYPRKLINTYELTFPACHGAQTAQVKQFQIGSKDPRVERVSITIGGNDVGFSDVVRHCVFYLSCEDNIDNAKEKLPELRASLDSTYALIERRYPNAEVYVAGYPHLLDPEGAETKTSCAGFIGRGEATLLNAATDDLNKLVRLRAEAHGFKYVNPVDNFKAHAACSDYQWINAITPPSAPYGIKESFHPNMFGTAAYARAYREEGWGNSGIQSLVKKSNDVGTQPTMTTDEFAHMLKGKVDSKEGLEAARQAGYDWTRFALRPPNSTRTTLECAPTGSGNSRV